MVTAQLKTEIYIDLRGNFKKTQKIVDSLTHFGLDAHLTSKAAKSYGVTISTTVAKAANAIDLFNEAMK